MSIKDELKFIEDLKLSEKNAIIASEILKEIKNRLKFLIDVGLDYLNLNRKAGTLSGGESQRIRLASQIGSRLVGILYILDEPSIGLHQRDNDRLIGTLKHLKDLGNTLVVVEHEDRKSTRLNSSHANISYAVFCLKKKRARTRSRQTAGAGSP